MALIGNPNCRYDVAFNFASGAREHVGNYPGVTVDSKSGTFTHGGYSFNIVDLPGTYSLSAYSPEERYVRTYLRENNPDVIVNVVDSSNLERNLYLTTELIDMDHSMVIALNMFDELRRSGVKFDYKAPRLHDRRAYLPHGEPHRRSASNICSTRSSRYMKLQGTGCAPCACASQPRCRECRHRH